MTPHEERLVLELHSKWGNRWSRIARKLPGRTDNEIKNYWRTHMRKKAQERKKAITPSSSSSNSSSSSSISNSPTEGRSFYDTGGMDTAPSPGENKAGVEVEEGTKVYSMDEIWKDIELSEEICQTMTSPRMNFCPNESLWSIDEEENKMLMQQMGDNFHSFPFYNYTG
ncbi:hypothetical protein CDL12_03306 [Handroanthus impetiginosus]|uniref:Uncharacterized protein n=1 Tax=Handroanthus impetiginosus TaxID=429701 RepID=A0A2G9I2H3_9LAMI|nr:hypothetical protein CDL12_03306 [Handroanthus impetiginosus]